MYAEILKRRFASDKDISPSQTNDHTAQSKTKAIVNEPSTLRESITHSKTLTNKHEATQTLLKETFIHGSTPSKGSHTKGNKNITDVTNNHILQETVNAQILTEIIKQLQTETTQLIGQMEKQIEDNVATMMDRKARDISNSVANTMAGQLMHAMRIMFQSNISNGTNKNSFNLDLPIITQPTPTKKFNSPLTITNGESRQVIPSKTNINASLIQELYKIIRLQNTPIDLSHDNHPK